MIITTRLQQLHPNSINNHSWLDSLDFTFSIYLSTYHQIPTVQASPRAENPCHQTQNPHCHKIPTLSLTERNDDLNKLNKLDELDELDGKSLFFPYNELTI